MLKRWRRSNELPTFASYVNPLSKNRARFQRELGPQERQSLIDCRMSSQPVDAFLPLSVRKGERKINRRSVVLLDEGYALGHYGDFLLVSLLAANANANGNGKQILVENHHRIKHLHICFPYVVSVHLHPHTNAASGTKHESIQVWNVQTSCRTTTDLWKKADTATETNLVCKTSHSCLVLTISLVDTCW